MQYLTFNIPVLTYCLCGASALFALAFWLLLSRKLKRVVRRCLSCSKLTMPDDAEMPPVSVIVHDDARAWNLKELLPRLLEQDYPAPIEVIVVNDGMRRASEDAIASLEGRYPNLYMTFLPEGSRSLSRRKLALMIGIKAARYDTIVVINGNCMIDSPMWLRAMTRHIARGKDLVIGWAYPTARPGAEDAGRVTRRHAFDSVRTGLQYLAWAIAGHPWRANGNNMAFRSRLFYENRGFAETLNLTRGEDDLWVKQVATADNTAVELSDESMVAVYEDSLTDAHRADKLTHEFTSRRPGRSARLTFALISWCWWLALLCGIAGVAVGYPSVWPLAFMLIVAIWVTFPLMVRWNRCSVKLHSRPLLLTVPWLMLFHPFHTLAYRLRGIGKRHLHYTAGGLR